MKLVARPPGDRDRPRLAPVTELAMAPTLTFDVPAIVVQEPEDVSNLHRGGVPAASRLDQMSIPAV